MKAADAAVRRLTRRRGILPGFRLTFGFTVLYLSLVVLLPLGALVLRSTQLSWAQFAAAVSGPRALAAYKLSFLASLLGALINLVFGSLLAWVLTRYRFPGKELADALVPAWWSRSPSWGCPSSYARCSPCCSTSIQPWRRRQPSSARAACASSRA